MLPRGKQAPQQPPRATLSGVKATNTFDLRLQVFWKEHRKEICKSENLPELALPFGDEWELEVNERVRRVAAGSERPEQKHHYL
jgi:hypothetical protein